MGRRKEERPFFLKGIGFSDKEKQVADLAAQGKTYGEITDRLMLRQALSIKCCLTAKPSAPFPNELE